MKVPYKKTQSCRKWLYLGGNNSTNVSSVVCFSLKQFDTVWGHFRSHCDRRYQKQASTCWLTVSSGSFLSSNERNKALLSHLNHNDSLFPSARNIHRLGACCRPKQCKCYKNLGQACVTTPHANVKIMMTRLLVRDTISKLLNFVCSKLKVTLNDPFLNTWCGHCGG